MIPFGASLAISSAFASNGRTTERIREARVRSVVLPFDAKAEEIAKLAPKGIILSGGPSSVYDKEAPQGDAGLFDLKVPVLGLCYGMMSVSYTHLTLPTK